MSQIGETIREHPKATAAFVIVGVVILFLLFRGGSSSNAGVASGTSSTDVQAATDAYVAQQQAAVQSQGIAAGLQSSQDQLGAQLQALQIQSQTTNNANNLQANVQLAQIGATQESTDLANTLSAQVSEAGISAQTQQEQIAANTTIQSNQVVANSLVQQATINANRDIALSNTQAATSQFVASTQAAEVSQLIGAQTHTADLNAAINYANIAASESVAKQSWFSKIF